MSPSPLFNQANLSLHGMGWDTTQEETLMPNDKKKDTDLVVSIGGEELLRLKYKPKQLSSNDKPLPYTSRGYSSADSEAVGAVRISINVIK